MPLGIHHFPNSTQKSRPSLRTRNGEQHEISRARKIERRFFFLQRPHSQPRESNHTSSQLFEIEQPHQPAVKLLPRSHLRTCKPEHGPKSTTVHNDPLLHLPPKATNQNTETCGPRDAPGEATNPRRPTTNAPPPKGLSNQIKTHLQHATTERGKVAKRNTTTSVPSTVTKLQKYAKKLRIYPGTDAHSDKHPG